MNKQLSLFPSLPDGIKTKKNEHWTLSIDGASRGNPGPAGAGIYLRSDTQSIKKYAFYLGIKTNNQAEYLALILGLYVADTLAISAITVISDSLLLIKQMQGHYRVKNQALIQLHRLGKALIKNKTCTFKHVLREKNKEADALANTGIDTKREIPHDLIMLLKNHGITLSF